MAFVGVEFPGDSADSNSVALVSRTWLTPLKKEVFWPPFKLRVQFEKAVRSHITPEDSWPLYPIVRCFFECDDYDKAQYKIKQAEITSDIQSELDEPQNKRKRVQPRRLSYGSSDDESPFKRKAVTDFQRPPLLKLKTPQRAECSDIPSESQSHNNNNNNRVINIFNDSATTINDLPIPLPAVLTPNSIGTKNDEPAYHRKLFTVLHQIHEQNKLILEKLDAQPGVIVNAGHIPENMPVALPLQNQDDVIVLEEYLKNKENFALLSSYLSSLGGRDLITKVNTALKIVISDTVASRYSFYGKRLDKQPFCELALKKVIVDAIKAKSPDAFEKNIEAAMKIWLKHAPQRLKLSQKRRRTL